MSDPFAHHPPTGSLEASTAITTVSDETMVHAAEQAARLVETTAGRRLKSGRFAKRETSPDSAAAQAAPAPERPEIEVPAETEAVPMEEAAERAEPVLEVARTAAEIGGEGAGATEGSTEFLVGAMADAGDGFPVEGSGPAIKTHRDDEAAPLTALRDKLTESFHLNVEASVSFWLSMIEVRSPSEALELNKDHLLQQMKAFSAQSRELSILAHQAATASMTSLVSSFGRLRG